MVWIMTLLLGLAASAQPVEEAAAWQPAVPLATLRATKAALIPFPREVQWNEADWQPGPVLTLVGAPGQAAELAPAVGILRQAFADYRISLVLDGAAPAKAAGQIRISLEPGVTPAPEGYQLTVASDGVTLRAADPAGAFYGAHTLRQLLRPEKDGVHVQTGTVRDWPAFRLRGFMHDVGRNFQTLDSLKAQLDRLAAYKLNVFHWHLTDNPGWRIESRLYPELNDPRFQTRDEGRIYTFAQIRELIAYARARYITVIPELDMPGHSDFFGRAFGFTMGSPQGRVVLEKLIDEFCQEIPQADRPYLHLGSDEVNIEQPAEFMAQMLHAVERNGSRPMIWNPGLSGNDQTVIQYWREDNTPVEAAAATSLRVDSTGGYLNCYDPLVAVQRHFFHQIGRQPEGDAHALGAILCLWNDTRLADKANLFRFNPAWPGLLAFADSVWLGRPVRAARLGSLLPPSGSLASDSFREFEDRLAAHRDRFFHGMAFPFVKAARIPWQVIGPFPRTAAQPGDFAFPPETKIQPDYAVGGKTLAWQPAWGGTISLVSSRKDPSIFPQAEIGTAYALTHLYSATSRTIHAWLGFETPERSNRKSGGIPPAGQWAAFGGAVWVNDQPLPAPSWHQPGKNQYLEQTFRSPANEDPFTDEEFYWTRGPVEIQLQAGWNKLLLRVPCGYLKQSWTFSFAPVRYDSTHARWVEDESVNFSDQLDPR